MRAISALLVLLCVPAPALKGQSYGEWDRPCGLRLPPRFSAPFVHGVIYQGKEFYTSWQSVSSITPLPSYNWYEPTPDPDPISTDRTSRWYDAKVKGHCTVERTPYYISYHTYPVEFEGTVRACPSGGRGGPEGSTGITDPALEGPYDPYDAGGESGAGCDDTSGGGSGGSEGATCQNEYVFVEISNDGGVTWQVIWEGWALVCA